MSATPVPKEILSLPQNLRVSLWMAYGAALDLPIDDLVKSIDLQIACARRTLKGKRVRMIVCDELLDGLLKILSTSGV